MPCTKVFVPLHSLCKKILHRVKLIIALSTHGYVGTLKQNINYFSTNTIVAIFVTFVPMRSIAIRLNKRDKVFRI